MAHNFGLGRRLEGRCSSGTKQLHSVSSLVDTPKIRLCSRTLIEEKAGPFCRLGTAGRRHLVASQDPMTRKVSTSLYRCCSASFRKLDSAVVTVEGPRSPPCSVSRNPPGAHTSSHHVSIRQCPHGRKWPPLPVLAKNGSYTAAGIGL